MSDTDLTDDEAQRLSALLHRAADGLPPAAPAPATRRHPGRWLAAAAAVAALVVGGVVLLRGDLQAKLQLTPLHPALDYFMKNPVPTEIFAPRFRFEPDQIADSDLTAFLDDLRARG